MYTISDDDGGVNDIYAQMVGDVMRHGKERYPRGTKTLELHPAIVEICAPEKRLVTSFGRAINVTFALAEILWILSGRDEVNMLKFYNSNIAQFSDDGLTFNAPYGYRLRHSHGFDQIAGVVRTLEADPDSRQAILEVWKPERDLPYVRDTRNDTKDRACNVLSHLMITDDALDWLQIVRSNDLVWGTPYNWMQFTHLQEWIARLLGVEMGNYVHVADSLHIYDYHWTDAAAISKFDLYEHLHPHPPMEVMNLESLQSIERAIRTRGEIEHPLLSQCGPWWMTAMRLFSAHYAYASHADQQALDLLLKAPDRIYAAAQCRFYWEKRWHKANGVLYGALRDLISTTFPPAVAEWITDKKEAIH